MNKLIHITVFIVLCWPTFAFAQIDPFLKEARTGETITLVINNALPADSFNVYRKTGVTSIPILLYSMPARSGIYQYAYSFAMPGGTTPQYRFWIAVKRNGVLEGESNIVRVKRIR